MSSGSNDTDGRPHHDREAGCPLCDGDGGRVLWRGEHARVVDAGETDYPGFLRVIWNTHVREWTDLGAPMQHHCMAIVSSVEKQMRVAMEPDKINLASLGNQVAHLHWHVIPRFVDDRHFPDPIWARPQRSADPGSMPSPAGAAFAQRQERARSLILAMPGILEATFPW